MHWTSGIELGVRLVSWAWVRRLLDGWPKVGDLFETNDEALRQIWWHQQYLDRFPSRGSSANNHAVAEQAGRLVAACAFPWYAESDGWRRDAAARLSDHFLANTWEDGLNRELATDYHRFVTELVTVAAVEAAVGGEDLPPEVWERLARSFDAAAALLDDQGAHLVRATATKAARWSSTTRTTPRGPGSSAGEPRSSGPSRGGRRPGLRWSALRSAACSSRREMSRTGHLPDRGRSSAPG